MAVLRNRCSGCEHYNGFYKDNVQCLVGEKVTIDKGCYRFKPDITANCYDCYFNNDKPRAYGITCSINGFVKNQKEYCQAYALSWDDNHKRSPKNKSNGKPNILIRLIKFAFKVVLFVTGGIVVVSYIFGK